MAPFHFGTLVYDFQAIDVIGPFDASFPIPGVAE